ncbi:universal stress protein [Myxococcota bacterium]|nr:universal stress protein [Myxococcota bacterium]
MTDPTFVRRIALPTDLAQGSDQVFGHGLALALHNHASLHLVHVHPADSEAGYWGRLPSVRELLARWGHIPVDAPASALKSLRTQVILDDVVAADPATGAAREVAGLMPDLLVLGTHRRKGLSRMLKGSVAERIARANRLPTLFLGHQDRGFVELQTGAITLRRIVVPVGQDLSPERAMELCARWLPDLGPGPFDITLVHVGGPFPQPPPTVPVGLVATVRQVSHNAGDVVAGVMTEVELERADLVVMASHGHDSWLDDIAGTKTEQLVRWCTSPVLVLSLS